MTEIFTGVIDDPRSKREKKKDWNSRELLAGSVSPDWKPKKNWRTFNERNQKATSSCVPQSVAKVLEINEKSETGNNIVFSASKPYADRSNEGPGAWLQEMLHFAVKNKYTTEERIPSQNLYSDHEMELLAKKWKPEDDTIASVFAGKAYLKVDINPDVIAHWIEEGYGVVCLFYFEEKEWRDKYPKIKNKKLKKSNALRHAVTLVDFGLIGSQKFFKIEDSAHFGARSERWLTTDWITKRCFDAGFVFDKPNVDIPPEYPKFIFNRTLWYGMTSDPDVVQLQDLLKREGLFPEQIPSTGNYYRITQQAVLKYQKKYQVGPDWELDWLNGRIVGPKTRNRLNQ